MSIQRKDPNPDTRRFRREWGCPLTKNRTPWCFAMCTPIEGMGFCGRIAPHTLVGRTKLAILKHEAAIRAMAPGRR